MQKLFLIKNNVNEFNEFIRTICQKLANDIHTKAGPKPCEFLTNRVSETIFLSPQSNNEILNLITSLKDNKAAGHDNIPAFYIKVACALRYHSLPQTFLKLYF